MGRGAEGPASAGAKPSGGAVSNSYEDDLVDDQLENDVEDAAEDEAGRQASDDVDVQLGEAGRNWERPAAPPLDERVDNLAFQQLDVDYFIGAPDRQLYNTDLSEAPILRIFGVTHAGNSVCLFVHGFEPYFYIEAPAGWGPDECDALRDDLNVRLTEQKRGPKQGRLCLAATLEQKQSIWHFQPKGQTAFIRLTFATPPLVSAAKGILQTGISISSIGFSGKFLTFESDVLFALRYMIDQKVVGCNWLELPPGSYRCVSPASQVSHCQYEVHANYARIVSHPAEGEWVKLSRFRILSVDIECAGRKGHFPEAEKDPVIQIASMVTIQGETTPIVKNVMTLDSCAAIVGAEVMSFSCEEDMLKRWRDLIVESDPDIIIGYNTSNFDLPYLIDRAAKLKVDEFPYWGRLKRNKLRMRDASFSSKAHGTHDYKEITIEGRIQFDVMWAIIRDHKLSSYSLNAVSAHFLGEQKEDVHHSIISDLQNGNEETRRRLAVYCLKDAYLPQRLVDKLMFMVNYMEMARVTGVPMSYLLSRGQSIKVYSQILRKAQQRGMVVPCLPKAGATTEGVGYEGATVLDPKAGFYQWPIATLDFASLYPSIMMAHNICYSTLVTGPEAKQMAAEDLARSPSGDCFVRANKCKGLLPDILEELLGARKRAKADLKAATDPFMKAVLDGRQLALKISANSVYGFTGATVGKLPCLEISASVTSFGREMIMHTREMVQHRFSKANGYAADCTVIYGDTDSVMVDFHEPDCAKAMELGRAAAAEVSATFTKPIKLEFEKVYYPYLLVSKKRYAGLLWTRPDKHDKMDTKGIETVRRDNCLLVRNVISTCLDKILIEKDVAGAKAFVCSTISDLLMNRMDLSLLVITKGLTQDEDKYKSKNAHAELAKKMRKRDPATAPNVGDRVPYVIIKAAKDAKAHEKAEDPIFVLEHGIPIDSQHYLEHHLKLPLTRLFEPLMKNSNELLSGDHTRSISMGKASQAAGGIMKFAKVQLSCLACKSPLDTNHTSLCPNCQSKEAEIYQKMLGSVNELEGQFGSLWAQCQRCQGSLHQDVLCTSRDCPIFYRRKKVQKDLTEAHSLLSRFQDW